MMQTFLLALLVSLPLLGGCANLPTPYQPKDGGWGYSDFPVGEDMFTVSFEGNVELDIHTFRMHLLRRASELTLGHEFAYFTILKTTHRPRPSVYKAKGFIVDPVFAFRQAIVIRCFKEDPGMGFNAAEILVTLAGGMPDPPDTHTAASIR